MERDQQAKPLWQAVADSLLERIESGEFQPNTRLPSEAELCEMFSVGRNTVRHALSELVNQGVLSTVHGVGTFVADDRLTKTAEFLYGFTQEMEMGGHEVTSQVLEAKIISADTFLARRLQIQLGAEVVFLNRLRLMDGEPTAIERAYLPHDLCPGILDRVDEPTADRPGGSPCHVGSASRRARSRFAPGSVLGWGCPTLRRLSKPRALQPVRWTGLALFKF